MYQLRLKPSAKKQLKRLNKKDKIKISKVFLELQKNPFIGKKLEGKFKGSYSLRIWPYRIIYEIYHQQLLIIVIRIGHRGGVYK